MSKTTHVTGKQYQPPRLVAIGTLHDLTLGCDKVLSGSDGFTFMGQPIHCSSA